MEDASGRIEAVESISEGARILEEVDTAQHEAQVRFDAAA